MSGLPPPPYYTRADVVPSPEYIQRSPFEKQTMFSDYQENVEESSFWQNSQTPNSYFMLSTLGRSVLPNLSDSQRFAQNYKITQPITLDTQRALWTAQVLAFWLTDGVAYRRYDGMEGLISRMGLDPKNPSAVLDANGLAITDLRTLLNPTSSKDDPYFVKGPDSLFGPELESIIEEYAGTRKLFGKDVPQISKPILDALITQFPTTKVNAANASFLAGRPLASRVETTETPCGMLLEDARIARKDCRGDSPKNPSNADTLETTSRGGSRTQGGPPNFASETPSESSNSTLYIGLLGLALAVGTAAYLYHNSNSKKAI